MFASWSLDRVLPQLELQLYDKRLDLYSFFVLGDTYEEPARPDARIVMAASFDKRQSGRTDDSMWGPNDDAQLLHKLEAVGISGVFFRRDYSGQDTAPLDKALRDSSGLAMVGTRWLPFGTPDRQVPPDLEESSVPSCIDAVRDPDGKCRAAYLALTPPGKPPVPSGSLRLLARLGGVPYDQIRYTDESVTVGSTTVACSRDQFGYWARLRFPLFLSGSMEVLKDPWRPLSLTSLLHTNLLYRLRGRVVLVGHFEYAATEMVSTPAGSMQPFRLQACLLDTILSGWTMREARPWRVWLVEAMLLFVLAVGGSRGRSWFKMLLQFALLVAGYTWLNFWLFDQGELWPLAGPVAGMLVTFATMQAVQIYRAIHHLQRFGGATAVQAALRMDQGALFESFERTATILFTNLPDHLKQLEKVGAPELFPRRKEYSRLVIDAVSKHGGQILDYQADFLMVAFNVDQTTIDLEHAYNAVLAALELQKEVEKLKDLWLEALDPSTLKCFCGICTGPVALGFVGAREHKKAPAAIGDTTNVAARLLGAAKKMGVGVLIAETTFELAGDRLETEELEPVSLKGKSKPVPVHRVLSLREMVRS